MDFSTLSVKQTLVKLNSDLDGLTAQEATSRLRQFGSNEVHQPPAVSLIKRILQPFASAFVIVLIVGGIVSLTIGNQADAIVIAVVVAANAVIEWSQQLSAAKILASLKRYEAKMVKVRRGGQVIELDARQLVPGDMVLLAEGEKVPADGRVIEATDLNVDESTLTGESLPVLKSIAPLKKDRPIYQQTSMLFAGTLIQSGRAAICVTATANQTQFGKIAKLASQPPPPPPIVKKVKQLTLRLVATTLVIAAATILLGLARGNSLAEMLRFGVALIVAIIPEGLPVTLTIILLFGVMRMAKKQAFVRNLQAVETLGMVTAVATDKTGTLTYNQMGIATSWDLDGSLSSADNTDFWLSVSHRHPDLQHPLEKIITQYTQTRKAPGAWTELEDLPFDLKRRFTVVLWQGPARSSGQAEYRLYIKGAPEVIIAACKLNRPQAFKIKHQLSRMTKDNMRVIAVAKKVLTHRPSALNKLAYQGMDFEGLIGFRDELRQEAKAAVKATQQAGIRVYMLTGDHEGTAQAIGQDVGIIHGRNQVIEGAKLTQAKIDKISQLLHQVRAFARVLPEHKFRLLEVLKKTEIVGMTGDGVNDAPALAKADVGIAMGSGSDAAKEAADMVLLDNNYATIVEAIREGRRIYANVRKMIYYQLSTNLAEAVVVIGGLLLGLPLVMTAAQVLWLNLVTDTTMIVPLGLEPAEPTQMRSPPRKPGESLLSRHLVSRLMLTVLVMAACSISVFWLFYGQNLSLGRTMAFLALCGVQWATAFNARSETESVWRTFKNPNHTIWMGIAVGAALIALAVYGPLQPYMGTSPVTLRQLVWLVPAIILTIAVSDLHKMLTRPKLKVR
ncbi:HAD-IC family P-type ATPase [Candidatus Microgenomates bacterium]|nr:HAD-IC family P-type ATPase [Candidatus Microgenomates bacterium]